MILNPVWACCPATFLNRHGRASPGHPRLLFSAVSIARRGCPAQGRTHRNRLKSIPLTLYLSSAGVQKGKAGEDAAVLDDLGHIGALLEAVWARAADVNVDAPGVFGRVRLDEHPEYDQRDRQDGQTHRYIPSGPRMIAAIPVRETSMSPSGSIKLMNCSILSVAPVISNTKLSVVASITRARNASANRRASTRFSPLPLTLTIASSRSMALPASVISTT